MLLNMSEIALMHKQETYGKLYLNIQNIVVFVFIV